MSFKRFAAMWCALAVLGSGSVASAAGEFGRSGPYLGAGGLYAIENFDESAPITDVENSWGYNLRGGYRFNEFFALELNWDHMLAFDIDPGTGDADFWVISASGKGYLTDGPIQPFLGAGLGYGSASAGTADETALAVRAAGGIDFYFSRNWAVTAEAGYIVGTGSLSDFDAVPLSVGVLYRFY